MKFLNFLKIIVGIPFFAVIGLLIAFIGFVWNSFFSGNSNPKKQAQQQALNKRKEQYKKDLKPIAVNDYQDYWKDNTPKPTTTQEKRRKKKALNKRRKRNRLAKKSRQQNRK